MDATELLKQDHRNVRKLFAAHERAGDNAVAEKKSTGEKIFSELDVHTRIEEEIFYPAARDGAASGTDELLAEAHEEHEVAKSLVSELRGMEPGDEQWDAKMTVLQEAVEHHIEEEEGELFPKVRAGLGKAYLQELGDKMAARKRELASPAPSLTGSLTQLVTRAFDSLTGTSARPRRTARRASASAKARKRGKSASTAAKKTVRKMKRAGRAATARAASTTSTARTRVAQATKKVRARAKTRIASSRVRAAKVAKTARQRATKRRRSARR